MMDDCSAGGIASRFAGEPPKVKFKSTGRTMCLKMKRKKQKGVRQKMGSAGNGFRIDWRVKGTFPARVGPGPLNKNDKRPMKRRNHMSQTVLITGTGRPYPW